MPKSATKSTKSPSRRAVSIHARRSAGQDLRQIAAEEGITPAEASKELATATPAIEKDKHREEMVSLFVGIDRKAFHQLDKHLSVKKLANPAVLIAHMKGRKYYQESVDVTVLSPEEIQKRRLEQMAAGEGKVRR